MRQAADWEPLLGLPNPTASRSLCFPAAINKSIVFSHAAPTLTTSRPLLLIRLGRDACRGLPPCPCYYCSVNTHPPHQRRSSHDATAPITTALGLAQRCLCSFTEIQVRPLRHSRYSNQRYCIISNLLCLVASRYAQMFISVDAVRSSSPSIQRPY